MIPYSKLNRNKSISKWKGLSSCNTTAIYPLNSNKNGLIIVYIAMTLPCLTHPMGRGGLLENCL